MTLLDREMSPAQIYDERFVPALFAQWGPIVAGEAGVQSGDRVLDVACGTGALTRAAASRTGPSGAVVGLDANPEMMAVARSKNMSIIWVEGRAEALPFADADFDAVVSQFGLMFFDDRPAALREMRRVLRPGGRMAVAVCDALAHSPGYDAFAGLLDRLFGKATGNAFRAPFALGDVSALETLCRKAGLRDASVVRHSAQVRFKSISALVATERACVWTLGGLLDDEQFERLLEESEAALAPFRQADGAVVFDMPALILRATAI